MVEKNLKRSMALLQLESMLMSVVPVTPKGCVHVWGSGPTPEAMLVSEGHASTQIRMACAATWAYGDV